MSIAVAGRRDRRSSAESVVAQPLSVTFDAVGRTFSSGDRSRQVLAGIDLEVDAGSVTALLGPSGCGKSTLLRIAGGLDQPSTGAVVIDAEPVRAFDSRCAIAFQEARLLPWRSIRDNVALGLARGGTLHDVDALLDLVGLTDSAHHRPREISGGMAQRASLARALARRPGVLLLDEPFGALDALTRIKMHNLLRDVHRAHPTTVLLVTHDVDEAIRLADSIVVLGSPTTENQSAATILHRASVSDGLRADPGASAALHHRLLECLGVHGR